MNKNEEDKLVNAIISLQQSMEKQLTKVNLLLAEHSRSILTLANKFDELHSDINGMRSDFHKLDASFNKYAQSNDDKVNNHETRIVHLEETRGGSFVAEPNPVYKKRKKKKR